jgi:hypothetical protein
MQIVGTAGSICALAFFLTVSCASPREDAAAQSAPSHPSENLPGAGEIMAKVAANQDQSQADRAHYVYVQHAKMVSRRGKTVMCDEITDYRVTPSAKDSHEQLLKLDGRLWSHHQYEHYTALLEQKGDSGVEIKKDGSGGEGDHDAISITIGGDSADREIVENMRQNLMHDDSKDGLTARLFPLTTEDQKDYAFQMIGRERMNSRDVFHIVFRPKDKNDYAWKGDAYIDTTAFQPVLVTTGLSRRVPFAVRTFLGTNLPGIGFTVTYAPQPDGVWFPSTFSTEFKIEVLFFFRREIILDAQNREFEKTHGDVKIVGEATPVENTQP